MAMEGGNVSWDNQSTSEVLCDLTEGYSFVLQSVLGVLAFSTLILKRYREPKMERRPFWIWVADTTKQALGMLEVHFVNLLLSALIKERECISYLVSFLLDSTVGLLLIYLLLKAVAWLVNRFQITPLRSGEYGVPFRLHYWLAQCSVYLVVMLVMKLIVGPLVAFKFWKEVDEVILPMNEHLRIAIVMFIVPLVVNVVMFWIVDSILMRKRGHLKDLFPSTATSVHFHQGRCDLRYGKLPSEDSDGNQSDHSAAESAMETVTVEIPSNRTLETRTELEEHSVSNVER